VKENICLGLIGEVSVTVQVVRVASEVWSHCLGATQSHQRETSIIVFRFAMVFVNCNMLECRSMTFSLI